MMESYHFDGVTYDEVLDGKRLSSLYERVLTYMKDHQWHSLYELQVACGGTETSISARLRDLRKQRFGAHHVDRFRLGNGLWLYRLRERD